MYSHLMMENKMYKVIIECELSEKNYENRHEFTKEISGGKIDRFETLLSQSMNGLYNILRFRYRKCVIWHEVDKWVKPQ